VRLKICILTAIDSDAAFVTVRYLCFLSVYLNIWPGAVLLTGFGRFLKEI
jgi:hypothetical protein